MSQPTLYEILSLSPTSTSDLTPALIKQAYRRALLTHHPDKSTQHSHQKQQQSTTPNANPSSNSNSNSNGHSKPLYTIDQISHAYTTLSSPSLRTQYDAALRTASRSSFTSSSHASSSHAMEEDFQTGIDTIDLDDMVFVESDDNGKGDTWYRSCRCGNERGFALTEEDMEENADLGEVLVQCADCTIWLRVCYVVAEDEVEDRVDGDEKR
ncbi:Diphthamide biosynthesis protein 4 [Neurospora sp. IMI 360204]|nr:Diphthamide biosynthesis protein 4 [Neurospora sp. IMI 360204]